MKRVISLHIFCIASLVLFAISSDSLVKAGNCLVKVPRRVGTTTDGKQTILLPGDCSASIPSYDPQLKGSIRVDQSKSANSASQSEPVVSLKECGPDFFVSDDSIATEYSWQNNPDGTIDLTIIKKPRAYDPHAQSAWKSMLEGTTMEKYAIWLRNKNDKAGFEKWHNNAKAKFASALPELELHRALIRNKSSMLRATYENLAYCSAMMGDTGKAMQYYNRFLECMAKENKGWQLCYSHYRMAILIMTMDEKGLDTARALLMRTLAPVDCENSNCWLQINHDQEHRVMSWYLVSEIDKRMGRAQSSEEALRKGDEELKSIAGSLSQNGGGQTSAEYVSENLRLVLRFENIY